MQEEPLIIINLDASSRKAGAPKDTDEHRLTQVKFLKTIIFHYDNSSRQEVRCRGARKKPKGWEAKRRKVGCCEDEMVGGAEA